jgi:hypothetical protein
MKRVFPLVLSFLPMLLSAEDLPSVQGNLLLGAECIHTFSSFDQITYLTTYSSTGEPIWEVAFNSKIISWELKADQLFVFSKNLNGTAFFLTCLDASAGEIVWERVIVAPSN